MKPRFDAEALYLRLLEQLRPQIQPTTALIGIYTGGVWLAERLHRDLGLAGQPGSLDVSFYRDDVSAKGLHGKLRKNDISFDIEGADLIIVDDVLFTGRTTRAALNVLFDYGRPRRIELAVLVDRGGRELPVCARYCPLTLETPLPASASLQLTRDENGAFDLRLDDV